MSRSHKFALAAALAALAFSGTVLAKPALKKSLRSALNIRSAGATIQAHVPARSFFNRKTWRILNARHTNEIVVNLRVVSNDGKILNERTTAYEIQPNRRGYRVTINQGAPVTVRNRKQLLTVITTPKSITKDNLVTDVRRAYVELSISLNPIDIYQQRREDDGAAFRKWIKTVHADHRVIFRSASIQL